MIDKETFTDFYTSHQEEYLGFAFNMTRGSSSSEDLVQQAFEKMWRAQEAFNGGSLRAWGYSILRNTILDYFRKGTTDPLEEWDCPILDYPGQQLIDQELLEAIEKLPYGDYLKMMMEDIGPTEASQSLGVSPNTVKSRFRRAREAAKKLDIVELCYETV